MKMEEGIDKNKAKAEHGTEGKAFHLISLDLVLIILFIDVSLFHIISFSKYQP